ncbi:MAG: anthranilate synthase component I family protein [Verrucomicrobia bacterium]|jgi:para-aminobenzoate synthetase component 1|nr:anthranilate synthase component I family protein [Verrucomicrobiota bacterium]
MRPLIQEITTSHTPESLVEELRNLPGVVLLRSALFDLPQARYSFVAARPFLTFRSFGSRCEIETTPGGSAERSAEFIPLPALGREVKRNKFRAPGQTQFGNPWHVLDALMSRYELLDEIDLPFPLGGCFGYWGYDLKNFVEPKLPRRVVNDLELPDCHVGFYDSLVVCDHHLGKTSIVSTGLSADGSRSEERAQAQAEFWTMALAANETGRARHSETVSKPCLRKDELYESLTVLAIFEQMGTRITRPSGILRQSHSVRAGLQQPGGRRARGDAPHLTSNLSRADFLAATERAQRYIRAGDIYQVNLSQRLAAPCPFSGWELFERLLAFSPAPFAAYVDCGDFQIASSSPEQFLRLSGSHITTRPIKGTRPRSPDATRDAQLAYELQTSPKELAELVMITDLLRNDFGRVCEFGSVHVPELARLERFAQVQHLVSTVEGRLRTGVTHFAALASCFPGGSITGAPKFRAMEIIDELEPIARGPYCGCHGYLGFNRESQLSISIRTAIHKDDTAYFHVGAGIVADSNPEAEYEETLAKAGGFVGALNLPRQPEPVSMPTDL